MLWMWLPVVLVAFAVCIWIAIAAVRRSGGDGVRQAGRAVYDRAEQKKIPDTPPT